MFDFKRKHSNIPQNLRWDIEGLFLGQKITPKNGVMSSTTQPRKSTDSLLLALAAIQNSHSSRTRHAGVAVGFIITPTHGVILSCAYNVGVDFFYAVIIIFFRIIYETLLFAGKHHCQYDYCH